VAYNNTNYYYNYIPTFRDNLMVPSSSVT